MKNAMTAAIPRPEDGYQVDFVFIGGGARRPESLGRAVAPWLSGGSRRDIETAAVGSAKRAIMLAPFTTIGLGIVVFAATDVDDLLLLIGLFADPAYGTWPIVAGQFLGLSVLFGLGVLGSFISIVIPPASIGLLGLAPIAIGATKLLRPSPIDDEVAGPRGTTAAGRTAAVAIVTVANGGDNLATYVPLFASLSGPQLVMIGATFAGMGLLWCGAARWLVNHRRVGAPLRRYGRNALPYLLIGLGLLILWRSGTLGALP